MEFSLPNGIFNVVNLLLIIYGNIPVPIWLSTSYYKSVFNLNNLSKYEISFILNIDNCLIPTIIFTSIAWMALLCVLWVYTFENEMRQHKATRKSLLWKIHKWAQFFVLNITWLENSATVISSHIKSLFCDYSYFRNISEKYD